MATGSELRSTSVGSVNRNRQIVLRKTDAPGNDHNQRVYVLACLNPDCRHQYGANGSDVFQRRCPNCQGGKPGLPVPPSRSPQDVLSAIDALPDEEDRPFLGAGHDAVLYGTNAQGDEGR
jgi:hypothetical protein